MSRNEVKQLLDELSVRINDGYAMAFPHVPYRHIFEQRGFARSRLPDNVYMLAAVVLLNAELDTARVRGSCADWGNQLFLAC